MRVEVFKCRFTGAIFEAKDREDYVKHLKDLRKEMRQERQHRKSDELWKTWIKEEKSKLVHVDMIVPWLLKNQKALMNFYNSKIRSDDRCKFYETDFFESISIEVRYMNLVSNTHQCPDNGITNWYRRDFDDNKNPLPRGYPGFHGIIHAFLKREEEYNWQYPVSDFFKFIGLKTGSGGGGNRHCRYECSLFLADWEGLSEGLVFNKLKGK